MHSRSRHRITIVSVLILACFFPQGAGGQGEPTLDQRLERLVAHLERQRQDLHIPGMSLAIVKDGEVILARGFGMADLESSTPAAPETIFAIGSTTKAFTATLVGTLVDEGLAGWDDPATKFLPWFTLHVDSDIEGEQVTLRDMLCHRTGFTRMGALTGSNLVRRVEVLRAMAAAEPWAKFRKSYNYNNEMFVAVAMCAGAAAQSDWESMMRDRLLAPLGMTNSTLSIIDAQRDPRLASGYRWEEEKSEFKRLPMQNIDVIGPAGSINSNVLDMARWIAMLLNEGEIDGRRVVSEAVIRETWRSNIEMSPGVGYGLGWFIHDWRGQPCIEHAGNTAGFGAAVAMLPDSELGFVLLTNVTATPLQTTCREVVFDALLGEWKDESNAPPVDVTRFDPYLGTYHADFGALNEDVTILVKGDRLALDVPSQMVFDLEEPNADGVWQFVGFPIGVSFNRDKGGKVQSLVFHQAGLLLEAPREGVVFEPEVDLDELNQYLGVYRNDANETRTVLVRNNRLAVDVPGQLAFELFPPDGDGLWKCRAMPSMAVKFERDAESRVTGLILTHNGVESERCQRGEVAGAVTLPNLAEIDALTDQEAVLAATRAICPYRTTGTVWVAQSGIKGRFTTVVADGGRTRTDVDLSPFGRTINVLDGAGAWVSSDYEPESPREQEGLERLQASLAHPLADWDAIYPERVVVRADTVGDRAVWLVKHKGGALPASLVYVDQENGDVLRIDGSIILPGIGALPVTTVMEDFREVEGVRMAFRVISTNDATGRTVLQIESAERVTDLDDDQFVKPPKRQ